MDDYEDEIAIQKQAEKDINNNFVNEYRKFTEDDYIRLQENLIAFKAGDPNAVTYIISTFHQFISKYARFICSNSISNGYKKAGTDKSLSRFVGLFMASDKNKKENTENKHKNFAKTCEKIQALFQKYEYWDIYNELVCALLNMATKYKIIQEGDPHYHKNGSFHMYVTKCFHYEAYNTLAKIINDPLTHLETYHIYDDFHDTLNSEEFNGKISYKNEENEIVIPGIKSCCLKDTETEQAINRFIDETDRKNAIETSKQLVLNENHIDPYDIEALNFNWTNGSTCSEMFDCLTSYERELLVLSFIQNKTDSEIARLYNCHRITIVKHKKEAVQKIKQAASNKKLLK